MSEQQQTLTIQQAIDLALQHHNEGRLSQAESIYQQILQSDPNQPAALHMLGVIAHQVGKNDVAVDLITKALSLKPDFAEAHCNLGVVLHALGKLEDAVASYRKALSLRRDYAEAHYNLGKALQKLGKLEDAVDSYQKAVISKPNHAKARNNLGVTLHGLDRIREAIDHFHKAISIKPDYAQALYNLGNAYKDLPNLDDAVASYRRAIEIEPDYVEAHNNLGNTLRYLGELDDSVASYINALNINPKSAETLFGLATVKTHTKYDEDIKAMENTYENPNLRDKERMYLSYGLGKVFEDLKRYEKAFEFFSTGNAIKRQSYDYSLANEATYFKKIEGIFNETFYSRYPQVKEVEETPIFIVGMPRSGTTLVEQVLASHPKVHGAGELPYLKNIITSSFGSITNIECTDRIRKTDNKHVSDICQEYITSLRKHSKGARFITDKMPSNYLFIGLINLMMPNAKIVHCMRDPLDTCLSIFKTFFWTDGHPYAYDLIELGSYYKLYRDLMQHWRRVLPSFIYDIQYEDVVGDQEKQSRDLLDYCGLEWDDACLEFYRVDRPIMTASATQVRRPIYKDSVQSWKRYKNQLESLRKILC